VIKMSGEIDMSRFLGKKTLIIGEVGSGKTRLLINILRNFISEGLSSMVTVIDMAPPRMLDIGGRIIDHDSQLCSMIRYLYSDDIRPARLLGKSAEEVMRIATNNAKIIDKLIEEYLSNSTEILMINDLTIFIHAGDGEKLMRTIEAATTFVGTAYDGNRLSEDKGTGITMREKQYVSELLNTVDNVIKLDLAR